MKAYKFRLQPTQEQAEQLSKEFGCARFVWNQGLIRREYAYQQWGVSLSSAYDISSQITGLKKLESHEWLKEATASVLQQKLIDQDKAFDNFFKGRASFPKLKKKSHAQSIRHQLDQRIVLNNYRAGELLKLPKLGELKVKWSQVPAGIPKMVTVSKSASGKYFVSFMCEVEQALKPVTGKVIGIDVGIKDVIVSSDGLHSGAPKFTYKYQRQLKKAGRKLSSAWTKKPVFKKTSSKSGNIFWKNLSVAEQTTHFLIYNQFFRIIPNNHKL